MASPNTSNTNTSAVTIVTDRLIDVQSNPEELDHSIVEKEVSSKKIFDDFSNSIVHLNVGGKKVSISRNILTMIEGTLLSTIFSDRSDKILVKDIDGAYFFDYDPVLFKDLINQLRYWSLNPLVTRVFSPPGDHVNEFISLVRYLKFDERFLSDTFSETVNSNVKFYDSQRLCIKTGEDQHCAYVAGNLLYSQGRHFIKLLISLKKGRIGFIGIRPASVPIEVKSTKNFLPIPHTFGIDDNRSVINGERILIGTEWFTTCFTNTIGIELNCDSRTMHITRQQYYTNDYPAPSRFFDLTIIPFPWQLFIVLKDKHDYVRLML